MVVFDQLFTVSVVYEAVFPNLSSTDPADVATNETMSDEFWPFPKKRFKVWELGTVTLNCRAFWVLLKSTEKKDAGLVVLNLTAAAVEMAVTVSSLLILFLFY